MPVYSYECPSGHEYDQVLPVKDYQKKTKCPDCKKVGKKLIVSRQTEPSFSDKLYPYLDPNLGRVCESPKHREQIMNEMGLHSKEGGRSTTLKQERYLMQHRVHLRPQI